MIRHSEVTPAVKAAVDALGRQFEKITFTSMPDGSVRVKVWGVPLGPPYAQSETWVGFTITALHPYADVYPHFVRPDLSRLDGRPLNPGIHLNNSYYGEPAVMVSRQTRSVGPGAPCDPLKKVLKVLSWLMSL
jgi:hypothetical protein